MSGKLLTEKECKEYEEICVLVAKWELDNNETSVNRSLVESVRLIITKHEELQTEIVSLPLMLSAEMSRYKANHRGTEYLSEKDDYTSLLPDGSPLHDGLEKFKQEVASYEYKK